MNRLFYCFAFLCLCSCSSLSHITRQYSESYYHEKTAFVGANLIPLNKNIILDNKTVLTEKGCITAILDSNEQVPEGYYTIKAKEKYLMPGLIDMHVHILDDGDMLKFLKYGVTTVRNMADLPYWIRLIGYSSVLPLREKQQCREVFGPDIYTCGRCIDGKPSINPITKRLTDSLTARHVVSKETKAGYDCLKIYDNLSLPVYGAIVASSAINNIDFAGHVPDNVGIDRVLDDRIRSIEHLTGYIDNNSADFIIPVEKSEYYIQKTKTAGVYNCPTLVIWQSLPPESGFDSLKNDPEFNTLGGHVKWLWKKSFPYYYRITYSDRKNYAGRMVEITRAFTTKLYQHGCSLLIGTDANVVGTYVGYSTWQEMELFSRCGMTNYEVLRSATVVAAEALRISDELGTIETGKRANLILLDKNPLEAIENIRTLSGISIRGFYFTRDEMSRMVEEYY